MNTQLPGNLAEIFPLKFRLREAMRFFRMGHHIVAEKTASGQRYSLKPWQYELLRSFDGKRSFEDVAREVHRSRPGEFTALGLLNFYNWLYSENLVLCECESIFELLLDEGGETADAEGVHGRGLSDFAYELLKNPKMRRALAVSAAVVLSLSVVRLVQVVSPVLEPPAKRLYVEAGRVFDSVEPSSAPVSSERAAAEIGVERIATAAQMPVDQVEAPTDSIAAAMEEPPPSLHDPGEPSVALPAAADGRNLEEVSASSGPRRPSREELALVEALRMQLEECRIRRDEFYLQNDEVGYRREVHRMTNLAREIGDIENAW